MSDAASDMSERHAAALARLMALGLELAERVQAQAMAAETTEELESLAGAFHRVSRSVRMSIALEARLAKAAQGAGADLDDAPAPVIRRPLDREFVNVICYPIYDPSDGEDQLPIGGTEREGEALALEAVRLGFAAGERPATRHATAAQVAVIGARIRSEHARLEAQFGSDHADAHASLKVADDMRREGFWRFLPTGLEAGP